MGIEARRQRLQMNQRPHQKPRRRQQHHRQSNLRADEPLAHPSRTPGNGVASHTHRRPQIDSPRRQRRQRAKEQAGQQRRAKSKRQNSRIHREAAHRQHLVRQQTLKPFQDRDRNTQSGPRAQQRQHQVLNPQLAKHLHTSRAQRQPSRNLPRSPCDPHQRQSGKIGAGDRQNKADRNHQHLDLRLHIAAGIAGQRLGIEPRRACAHSSGFGRFSAIAGGSTRLPLAARSLPA